MIVGDDDAGRIDDEAGAERIGAALLRRRHRRRRLHADGDAQKFIEEIVERRARIGVGSVTRVLLFVGLRRRNIDDRIADCRGEIGE